MLTVVGFGRVGRVPTVILTTQAYGRVVRSHADIVKLEHRQQGEDPAIHVEHADDTRNKVTTS